MEEQLLRLEGYIQAMELKIKEERELESEDQLMDLYNEVQYIIEDLKYSPCEDEKKERELLNRFEIVCSQFETPNERLEIGRRMMYSEDKDDDDGDDEWYEERDNED